MNERMNDLHIVRCLLHKFLSVLRGEKELRNANNTLAQVQEAMQPMQQVMSDAASILESETAFETVDLGHARKELKKVNVSPFCLYYYSNLQSMEVTVKYMPRRSLLWFS